MGEFQVKRIILPSGKAVEIVYFQSEPGVDTAAQRPDSGGGGLEVCPDCAGELVHPTDWHELCAVTGSSSCVAPSASGCTGVHDEADVQRYDALLNDGTDKLIERSSS